MLFKLKHLLAILIIFTLTTEQAFAQTTENPSNLDGLVHTQLTDTELIKAVEDLAEAKPNGKPTPQPLFAPGRQWNSVDELVNFAAYTINYYWQDEFQKAGLTYFPPQIFGYYTQPVELGCGPTLMNNASYCFIDHSIAYDYFFFDNLWKTQGDFAPVVVTAHEWAHLVQAHFNLLDHQLTELQADCLAGAYAQKAGEWGLLEAGDLQEGAITLYNGGNPDTPWFDHGTPEQRVQAFEYGLTRGIAPCLQDYNIGGSNRTGVSNFSGKVHSLYIPIISNE